MPYADGSGFHLATQQQFPETPTSYFASASGQLAGGFSVRAQLGPKH